MPKPPAPPILHPGCPVYVNGELVAFALHGKNVFGRILHTLGASEIEVGDLMLGNSVARNRQTYTAEQLKYNRGSERLDKYIAWVEERQP